MPKSAVRTAAACLLFAGMVGAQNPANSLNPPVQRIVESVSEQRILSILAKLESFGTRHVMSAQDDPSHGIGAAMRWIHEQLQSYSPRLQVRYQPFKIRKAGAYAHDADLANVIAVLPGTTNPEISILVSGHYDSVNLATRPVPTPAEQVAALIRGGMAEDEARLYVERFPATAGTTDADATAAQKVAPGVSDDGSGTAIVLELARVLSQYRFRKTLVFVAFAAEEGSHAGSLAYAAEAKKAGSEIEAVLNNDIVGTDRSGNGRSATDVLRVFGEGPEDSPARAVMRYAKEISERYVPSMRMEPVFRLDRFSRGGDHMSFTEAGYPAVRLTSATENFADQHSATDTLSNASVPYATRAARMNAAVAASLAFAPAPPVVDWTFQSGPRKGQRLPMLTRGASGYDAVLRWEPSKAADLAGYAVVERATTAPTWEKEIWVGNVTGYTISDLSIDDIVLGVKAVDKDGNASLVSAYKEPPYRGAAAQ
jgi:Zn-dependent M28 family amino/carboxypeptidase